MGSVKLRTILGPTGAYEKISVIRYPENEVFRGEAGDFRSMKEFKDLMSADILELFSDRGFEISILVDPKTND